MKCTGCSTADAVVRMRMLVEVLGPLPDDFPTDAVESAERVKLVLCVDCIRTMARVGETAMDECINGLKPASAYDLMHGDN